jgi:spermidine synthase
MLAQCLSIILGNTVLRYSITIGLYLFSLGMGALTFTFLKKEKSPQLLFFIETILALIGLVLPFLMLGGDQFLRQLLTIAKVHTDSPLYWLPSWIFMHAVIILVGLLSGAELPILMELGRTRGGERGAQLVLAVDYVGTFLGALAFPLLIYEKMGLIAGAALLGGLNALVALAVLVLYVETRKPLRFYICGAALFMTVALMGYEVPLRNLLVEYVFG